MKTYTTLRFTLTISSVTQRSNRNTGTFWPSGPGSVSTEATRNQNEPEQVCLWQPTSDLPGIGAHPGGNPTGKGQAVLGCQDPTPHHQESGPTVVGTLQLLQSPRTQLCPDCSSPHRAHPRGLPLKGPRPASQGPQSLMGAKSSDDRTGTSLSKERLAVRIDHRRQYWGRGTTRRFRGHPIPD